MFKNVNCLYDVINATNLTFKKDNYLFLNTIVHSLTDKRAFICSNLKDNLAFWYIS